MSFAIGLAFTILAIIGLVRVIRAIVLASRKTLARIGRALAQLDARPSNPVPELEVKTGAKSEEPDAIAQVASLCVARAKRQAKASAK